ncbi:SGNH/GDSL hydrolase family protein [Alloscardovia theropitheci]|nr:SGNH/GDSL hydrolase family protein [Alloscardovia theropitheci]
MSDFAPRWEKHPGNAHQFDVTTIKAESSELSGKTLFALGSSITWGYASGGQALGEYLAQRFNLHLIKDAVNGTSIAGDASDTYVARLKKHNHHTDSPDMFLIQLSTNDVWQGFNEDDVITSIREMIAYIEQEWNVPIVFYTNTHFDNEQYAQTVSALQDVCKQKSRCSLINLWNNVSLNNVTANQLKLYMYDNIHPTRAGYMTWWGPEVARQLLLIDALVCRN